MLGKFLILGEERRTGRFKGTSGLKGELRREAES